MEVKNEQQRHAHYLALFEAEVAASKRRALRAVTATVIALAVLLAALVPALIYEIASMTVSYTLEAGDSLPAASTLCRRSGVRYEDGVEEMDFSQPGSYEFYIMRGERRIRVKLTVKDTRAPSGSIKALTVSMAGPFPSAMDFFDNLTDASEIEARYTEGFEKLEVGTYEVPIELGDVHGNKRQCKGVMNVIVDTEAPVFVYVPTTIYAELGGAVAYRKDIQVTDNCFGEVALDIDSSAVNVNAEGEYPITITARDGAGNKTVATSKVRIQKDLVTLEKLYETYIIPVVNQYAMRNMSKEQQVKTIYGYVNDPKAAPLKARIIFTDASNTDRSDWVQEAYAALQNGSGDCYSYFAVSKAFFEYLGIENRDIYRAKDVTTASAHYWHMVNIGSSSAPRWYYYDATRLEVQHASGNACLFTEAQRNEYNTSKKPGFLYYNSAGYPTVSSTVINTKYTW